MHGVIFIFKLLVETYRRTNGSFVRAAHIILTKKNISVMHWKGWNEWTLGPI